MSADQIIKKLNRAIVKGINNHCFGTQNGYVMKCHEKSEYNDKPCYCIEACYRNYFEKGE